MPHFHVRVSTDDLVFSAAHFITLEGSTCEPLHGHNYHVAAEVHGPLGPDGVVIDFVLLRETLREIVGELDQRVLLPSDNPLVRLTTGPGEIEVVCGRRRWSFPRQDCLVLPMANTTAELLAAYLGRRLLDELESGCRVRPAMVRVRVEERRGISAECELGR
ncbi:MAG TPA: 6-pyruvoyl tetrahydropterin synthase family protein [Thermoguttaceae bacterium]|nr:6-pyruvoyl tetrahydropterin synthase family protein [Thermoguttaceae bacterium]